MKAKKVVWCDAQLDRYLDYYRPKGILKGQKIRNDFFKPTFPPKEEQKNSTLQL